MVKIVTSVSQVIDNMRRFKPKGREVRRSDALLPLLARTAD